MKTWINDMEVSIANYPNGWKRVRVYDKLADTFIRYYVRHDKHTFMVDSITIGSGDGESLTHEDEQSEANILRGVMPCSFVRSVDSQKHTFLDGVGTWHHKPYYGPQRKVVNYDVLIEAPKQLCMEIRKRLKDGWELLGGVSVYYSTTGALQRPTLQLVQAVVKYE